jgi:hypothetical protein
MSSAPEEGDSVVVIKIQNILCQKQSKNYKTFHRNNEIGLNLSCYSYQSL